MKYLLVLCLLFFTLSHADEKNDWELTHFQIYFENDIFGDKTDSQYSSGEKFTLIYSVHNQDYFFYDLLLSGDKSVDSYINFSIVNQIFTPTDLSKTDLIKEERPYAGWTFFETGIHKSSKSTLQSLYIQIGAIGPRSYSKQIQIAIHKMTDSDIPMGWDNQIKNELGVNLRYIHKWRFEYEASDSFSIAAMPAVEIDLGNVSTSITGAIGSRIGWNIPKDFGMTSINTGGETGIQAYNEYANLTKHNWSFCFNLNLFTTAVARDVFLDGNLIQESHSVEKYPLYIGLGTGISMRYKRFALDYIYNKTTKHYHEESYSNGYRHGVGSVIISMIF